MSIPIERRPIVTAACCWVLGIHFAIMLPFSYVCWSLLGLGLLLPLMEHVQWIRWKAGCLSLLLIFLSASYYAWYDGRQQSELPIAVNHAEVSEQSAHKHDNSQSEQSGTMEGTIASSVHRDGDRVQFRLRVSSFKWEKHVVEPNEELVLVQMKLVEEKEVNTAAQWKRGMNVKIDGVLKTPSDADNFGAFDYRRYLRNQHIHTVFHVKGAESLQLTNSAHPMDLQSWMGIVERIRMHSASQFDALFPPDQSTYLQGLILGLRADLDLEIEKSFAQLGLTHVLAISGLHVAVFVGGCLVLFRLFRMTKESALIAASILIPFYVLFTGASPSIVRAGIMSLLVLIGVRQGWLRDGLHILSAVLLLMLLWEPYYAVDVSFQLSFAVTAGLIIGVPPFMKLLPARWPQWVNSALAVSIVAQAVSFPLTIYYFNQVSLISLGANLLFVPFISFVVLPLGTFVLIFAYLYMPLAEWTAEVVRLCNDWTFAIVHRLAEWEGATVIWPTLPVAWMLIYYMFLFLTLHVGAKLRNRDSNNYGHLQNVDDTVPLPGFIELRPVSKRPLYAALISFIILWAGLLYMGYHAGRPAETIVSFIDVGQGDSILIRTAAGRNLLIDGGGEVGFGKEKEKWKQRRDPYEVGEKRLVPLLKKRGIRHLDAVIVTHGDADHAGGLRAVLKHIPTERLVMNGTWKSSKVMQELYTIAVERHIPIMGWHTGTSWQVDEHTRIDVWHPKPTTGLKYEEEQNVYSLVLLLTIAEDKYESTFLLTGDMGAEEESVILALEKEHAKLNKPYPERVDVLKVAHHGSRSSTTSEWAVRWKPRESVISVGKHNRYGHPHPQVLRELVAVNSVIFRTDLHGEVQYKATAGGLKRRIKHDRIAQ